MFMYPYMYRYFKCLYHDCIYTNRSVVAVKKGRGKKGSKKAPQKVQKVKKERDENAPKRAVKSFNLFLKDKRKDLKAANPGANQSKLEALAKSLWKTLSSEDKAPYDAQREIDRERADKERAEYVKTLPPKAAVLPVALETSVVKPQQRVVGMVKIKAPKGPTSSFNLFFMDIRMTIKGNRPEWGSEDIIREAVVMWKSLTEEERQPYEDRAKADKERVVRETEEFESGKKRKRDEPEIVLADPTVSTSSNK
jgi:hypothetical protein